MSKIGHVGEIPERYVHSQGVAAEIGYFDKYFSTLFQNAVELRNQTSEVFALHVFENVSGDDEIHAPVRKSRKVFDDVGEHYVAFFGFLLTAQKGYGRFGEIDE